MSERVERRKQVPEADQKSVIDALFRVNRFLSEVTDLHRLLELVMEESKQVAGAEASSLILYDKDTDELFFEVALGEKGEAVKLIRLAMGQGIAGACALSRQTIVVDDCAKDDRHYKKADETSEFTTRNLIATAMVRQGRLIGVLEVLNKRKEAGGKFTEQDVKVLEFFSDQAAIAIENAQLVQANIASERLAAVGQAVAGISHYVKNILAGIKGSSSLVEYALAQGNINMVEEIWPVLQRSNQKIGALVQDMLTYSKERKPELALGNMNQVLEDIVNMCQESARDNQVELESELDSKITPSMFDGTRVHDAVLNLVNNACDACKDIGGAKVRVVSVFHEADRMIEIRVEDNGTGIPENIQRKIFEPFFSTKGSKGTGLGLAVTRKIIEEHEGTIALHSEEGVGTTFTIHLPFIEPRIEGDGGE
ncbi:MAG: GAF domain-containing sensor histidine kinase [bacterium]